MKKYHVNVNGNDYEIAIELLDDEACCTQTPTVPVHTPKPTTPMHTGSVSITSPMPGIILKVNFAQGATVKKGDVIMILEAMKMENEILAPQDGKLISLNVTSGASVESGTLLCTLG